MGFGFKRFWNGIRLVPNATNTTSLQGDLQTDGTTSRLLYNDGTGASPVVTDASVDTLLNKTLTSPILNNPTINGGTITPTSLTVKDGSFIVENTADNTKQFQFDVSSVATGTDITLQVPPTSTTLVGTTSTQTLTNKTLTSPTINGGTLSGSTLTSNTISLTGNTITGILSNVNGGTGQGSAFNADGVVYASSTTQLATTTVGTAAYVLTSQGAGMPPVFAPVTPSFAGLTADGVIYAATTSTVASTSAGTAGQYLASDGGSGAPFFTSFTAPKQQIFTSTGTTSGYIFNTTAASPGLGSVYTNNGHTFTCIMENDVQTLMYCTGTGAPSSSGTLTYVSGTPNTGNISFSSFTTYSTYNPTTSNILYLKVRMVGPGGGGGADGSGGNGVTPSFNCVLGTGILTCTPGNGGEANGGFGGTGGTAFFGSEYTTTPGVSGMTWTGGTGQGAASNTTSQAGQGASSPFGGAGSGVAVSGNGGNAVANTGSGGGGGTSSGTDAGAGGGAGGYIEALVTGTTLASWISSGAIYAIIPGGAGGAGSGGGNSGGNGGSSYIEITEYYQ